MANPGACDSHRRSAGSRNGNATAKSSSSLGLRNLAPDHLDWHVSMGGYALTKTKVWQAPVAIGNIDDEHVAGLLTGVASRAQGRRVGVASWIVQGCRRRTGRQRLGRQRVQRPRWS